MAVKSVKVNFLKLPDIIHKHMRMKEYSEHPKSLLLMAYVLDRWLNKK